MPADPINQHARPIAHPNYTSFPKRALIQTHTPSSSRKEVQFPWQCVTANEGKKEDKEV